MDSDRVPNRTVSHSQAVTAMPKTEGRYREIAVHRAAPTSTVNMTGEWIICRGASFLTASGSAAATDASVSFAGALVWCLCSPGVPRGLPSA